MIKEENEILITIKPFLGKFKIRSVGKNDLDKYDFKTDDRN